MFDEICKPLPEPTIDQIMENGRERMRMLNEVAYADKRKSHKRNSEYREALDHIFQSTAGDVARKLHYEVYGRHTSHPEFGFMLNSGWICQRIKGPYLSVMMKQPGFDTMRFTRARNTIDMPWHPCFDS